MHVAVCTIVHHPQDARILHRQIRALTDAGHSVTYIAPWSDTSSRPPPHLRPIDVPRAIGRRRLAAVRAARHVLRQLRSEADVVLLHDPELLLSVIGMRHRPATVWDVHEDLAASLTDKPWLPPLLRPPLRAVVRLAEHWAETRLHLILAEDSYQVRFRHRHPVIHNQTLVPQQVPPPHDDRVVYLGRISRGRGALELLELANLLPDGVGLHLVGPADPDVAPLLRAAHSDGLLHWHGFVPNDQALQLVDEALAGLSLLHDEPNYAHSRPTKVVEYMARGIPVITTPNPLAAALVNRYDCGIVVGFGDVRAVAQAIAVLAEEPERRADLGRRGHEAARAFHDWASEARRFVEALEAASGGV